MSVQKRYIEGLDFFRVVEFIKDKDNHLRCKIIPNDDERIDGMSRYYVYAHYVEDELVYIGESSDMLKRRMNFYCCHVGMTNVRVRKYFNDQFKRKKTSDICTFIHLPGQICLSEAITINPYVSVEQALIHKLKPKLNRKDVLDLKKKPRKYRK